MIGGIFETVGKTLGIGKEKYFLELDDAAEVSVEKIKKTATQAVETAKDVSSDVADKAQDLVSNASESAEASAKNAATKAKATTAKSAASNTKEAVDETAVKSEAAAKKAVKEAKADAVEKKPTFGKKSSQEPSLTTGKDAAKGKATSAAVDPEELIVAAIAATASGKTVDSQGNVVEAPTGFADTYLMPRTGGRRRPGPSLSGFKGMAKEVNPRLK
ncbi:MAG: hypothetical protein AAFV85_02055 [Cyanobacteria bacterium J06634_6]